MIKILPEIRSFPRIKTNLKVDISGNIRGDSIDLSEGGLSFSSTEIISSPDVSLHICFPDSNFKFKANAKLIWKRDLQTGISLYGMEFVELNESQKTELREELIRTQISGLLNEIKIPEIKKQISDFFLKDILDYINEIIKFNLHLTKEKEYSQELEKRLDHLHTKILLKGYCIEELLSDAAIMQKIKDNFRQLVGVWIYKSAIVKQAFEKPWGYCGDYKMLEVVYDNKPISKNLFGVYFDNNFLKSPFAVAVRARKDQLKVLLQKFVHETRLAKINILNIACGSCREVRELLPDFKTQSHITFTCLDSDEEALRFSQDMLSGEAQKNTGFRFIKGNLTDEIKNEAIGQSLGKQNLIYSIGLIDYLPDTALKKLLPVLFYLLEEGGKLILTHINKEKTFAPILPDWCCDWRFIPRNKEEVIRLFYTCGISRFLFFSESDNFGYIYYFTITKSADSGLKKRGGIGNYEKYFNYR